MTISSPTGQGSPGEVLGAFFRLGLTSFGGPVAHLGYFREELVSKRKWVSDDQYAELVALCQFLPGPASSQVGFALGLIRGGYLGALAAWAAFTLPSALLLMLFALGTVALDGPVGAGLLMGLKAVAAAVVAHAVWGMARTLTPDLQRIIIGLAALVLALLMPGNYGQLIAILGGIIGGLLWCRRAAPNVSEFPGVGVSRKVGVTAIILFGLLLAALPLLAQLAQNSWVSLTDAFYRAGALVFGGGHVVLPLLQAEPAIAGAVSHDQFLAGYGAAQAVPGPLFTFAAYLGFEMETGTAAPWASLLALLAVFLPGILLLLAALPFWDLLRTKPMVRAGMAGANAAVVGILAAALWNPIITSGITGFAPLIIAIGGFAMLTVWKLPAWWVVIAAAGAGLLAGLFGLNVAFTVG